MSKYSSWIWPLTLLLSTIAAGCVEFVTVNIAIRPVIVMWFLFICPGMAVMRFFQLREAVTEWTLALALSLSLDAIVAGILMYAKLWSPGGTLLILMGLCCCGAILQLVTIRARALNF